MLKTVVKDWKRKYSVIGRISGAETIPQLINWVFEKGKLQPQNQREEWFSALADTMSKWPDSFSPRSDKALEFFKLLPTILAPKVEVSYHVLMTCSYEEFLAYQNETNLKKLRGIVDVESFGEVTGLSSNQRDSPFEQEVLSELDPNTFTMTTFEHEEHQIPSIRTTSEKGIIDQRLFYQHPDSAVHWEGVINARQYPNFDKCKYSLDELWATSTFKNYLESSTPVAAVMLGGGGAFSKDVALISALLSNRGFSPKSPLHYILLDVSTWMLRRSRFKLAINWRSAGWGSRVGIELIVGDFMTFNRQRHRKHLRRHDGPIIWTLTGGTIGNVSETDLFSSLDNVTSKGDMLVIGASIHSTDSEDASSGDDANANAKYLGDPVKALIRGAIQDLASHLRSNEPLNSVLDTLSPSMREGIIPGVAEVPNSSTMFMSAKVHGEQYDVFKHTYYDPDAFIEFCQNRGWRLEEMVRSEYQASDFGQFCFIKDR